MFGATVIVFREVLEAALVIGVVLAATHGVPRRGLWIAGGVAGGIVGACVVALFADVISAAAAGFGQELFNAGLLAVAVAMLTWHVVWMQTHARQMVADIRHTGAAVSQGTRPLYALAVIAGVAVLREGAEVVLFLFGMMTGGDAAAVLGGGALGLAGGALVGGALYLGLVSIPTRVLFSVTGTLVVLLAAGMAAQAAHFLVQADLLDPIAGTLWDTSAILSERSVIGQLLHGLIGYVDRPSGIQVTAYAGTILAVTALARLVGNRSGTVPAPAE
jgi:high-affinity iron transporter